MRGLFANKSLSIEVGQAVSGIAHNTQTLRIISGRVWVTVEGIPQDYWLSAGDTLTVVPGRLVVVEADKIASKLDVMLASQQAALLKMGAQLLNNFTRRLGSNKSANTISHQHVRPQSANCCT